jgi:sugar lactone lactonase YvrE
MKRLSMVSVLLCALAAAIVMPGCGGGSNDTYNPTLTGPGVPSFTLAVSPSTRTAMQGQSVTYTVTLTAVNGFNSPVTLGVSGLPGDTTGTFNPASVTPTAQGATSTLTISTSGTGAGALSGTIRTSRAPTPTGTYTFTVTGSGGGVTRQATGQLIVQSELVPMFTLGASPASNTVTAGQSTTYTVTVNSENGFSSPVDLTGSGLPSGATASFSPSTVTPGSQPATSTLTVQTGTSTPAGTSTLTITGTSGTKTNTASVSLVVNAPVGGGGALGIYIADTGSHRIVKMNDTTGAGWTSLGGLQGPGVNQFSAPGDIHLDSQNRIYVADRDNNRIVRVNDISGAGWTTYGTNGTGGVGQFREPWDVFIDANDRIYIADRGFHRIVRIDDMTGAGWVSFGTQGTGVGQFNSPNGVVVDASGHIYISDAGQGAVKRIARIDDMSGAGWTTFGTQGNGVGQFEGITGIAIGPDNRLYINDLTNSRIVRIDDITGAGWTTIGVQDAAGGPGQFAGGPWDLHVDSQGRIYAFDVKDNTTAFVRMDDMTGAGWLRFGSYGGGSGQFLSSFGIFVRGTPP